jgi:hypothetical protein
MEMKLWNVNEGPVPLSQRSGGLVRGSALWPSLVTLYLARPLQHVETMSTYRLTC